MRGCVKEFVRIFAKCYPVEEPIFEFGSLQVQDQIEDGNLRPIFQNKQYVGCDMREGLGVDKILNLHDIEVASNFVGTVLCLETLEHTEFPRKAMQECHRILKPNGIIVISSQMNFKIHSHPYDYWRFTPEGFKSLLSHFEQSFVGYAGDYKFPHVVVGIGVKGTAANSSKFESMYKNWQKQNTTPNTSIVRMGQKYIPPVFIPFFYRLYKTLFMKSSDPKKLDR